MPVSCIHVVARIHWVVLLFVSHLLFVIQTPLKTTVGFSKSVIQSQLTLAVFLQTPSAFPINQAFTFHSVAIIN